MDEPRVRSALQYESSGQQLRCELRLESLAPEPVLVGVECTYPTTHAQWLSASTVKTPRGLACTRPFAFLASPGRMLLCFGRIPLPPGVEAYAPFLPLYARLLQGESRVVSFALPLPLDELDPYFDPPSVALTAPDKARQLVAVTDYVAVADTAWIDRGPHGLAFCSARSFVRVHAAVDVAPPLPVRRRTDPFYRPALDERT